MFRQLFLIATLAGNLYTLSAGNHIPQATVPAGTVQTSTARSTLAMALMLPELVAPEKKELKTVWVTAYSSTPEETDDTPFVTASGTTVRDGVMAANFLPFGTKVQIPELFGDKIFTVEDRMHRRKTNFVDVWMPSKEAALRFGISYTDIVILEQ